MLVVQRERMYDQNQQRTGGKDQIMYTETELVRVARRENNNKRKYLVVNRLQGKHIPVKPCEALAMFRALADLVKGRSEREKLLVIGFAETATAVGAAVAAELEADYMQTTREQISGVEYLYFSEEHSHATEQKLVKDDIDNVIDTIERIVFVEDEVTTGKTILNIINILKQRYSQEIKYSVASILNGMDETALDTYRGQDIELFWLVKTDHAAYTEIAETYRGDGSYIVCKNNTASENRESVHNLPQNDTCVIYQSGENAAKNDISVTKRSEDRATEYDTHVIENYGKKTSENDAGCPMPYSAEHISSVEHIKINKHMDTRRIVNSAEYAEYCSSLYQELVSQVDFGSVQNMLVLGTEEYMYPALCAASRFEARGKDVRFHATTRSPIAVSTEDSYPLHTRYELNSLYDSGRTTYIYDLQKYDTVVIFTDAKSDIGEGLRSLIRALQLCGNDRIILVH